MCDVCPKTVDVAGVVELGTLPLPWRIVRLVGWHGDFHVCGKACERALRNRYARPEDSSVASVTVPLRRGNGTN